MTQLICSECGRVVDATANRCAYCGCPVEVMRSNNVVYTQTAATKFCQNCGKVIDNGVQYCPHCGCRQNGSVNPTILPNVMAVDMVKKNETDAMSIVGFVVALISLFLNFAGIVGIAATVLSVLGISRCQQTGSKGKGLAIAGTVIGGISVLYAFFVLLLL